MQKKKEVSSITLNWFSALNLNLFAQLHPLVNISAKNIGTVTCPLEKNHRVMRNNYFDIALQKMHTGIPLCVTFNFIASETQKMHLEKTLAVQLFFMSLD